MIRYLRDIFFLKINNCQRVRNGMNNSNFYNYEFYRVRKPFTPPDNMFGDVPAVNLSLFPLDSQLCRKHS